MNTLNGIWETYQKAILIFGKDLDTYIISLDSSIADDIIKNIIKN